MNRDNQHDDIQYVLYWIIMRMLDYDLLKKVWTLTSVVRRMLMLISK